MLGSHIASVRFFAGELFFRAPRPCCVVARLSASLIEEPLAIEATGMLDGSVGWPSSQLGMGSVSTRNGKRDQER